VQPKLIERKPAISRAYVDTLEKRLEAMEAVLQGLSSGPSVPTSATPPHSAPLAAHSPMLEASETSRSGSELDEIAKLGEKLDDLTIEAVSTFLPTYTLPS
jgi:hypothetical protein